MIVNFNNILGSKPKVKDEKEGKKLGNEADNKNTIKPKPKAAKPKLNQHMSDKDKERST